MVRSTWSMWMIFRLPTLTWRKQVQSFPLLLRPLLSHQYFIYLTIIAVCEDLAAGKTIRNGNILLNNIDRKQDFKLVAPSNLTPLFLFKPFAWEGSNDKVIYAGWIFKVCSTPVLFALCNGFAMRYFHIFLIVKFLYLSQKMDQEPFDRWCSKF